MSHRVGDYGFPIETGDSSGYLLGFGWFAVGIIPATIAVHMAAAWRVSRVGQSLIGAAILAPALLVGVTYWVM